MANMNRGEINTAAKLRLFMQQLLGTGQTTGTAGTPLVFAGSPAITGSPAVTPTGGTLSYPVLTAGVAFVESALGAAGTFTGTVEIPAGAVLHDILFMNTVLWDEGTAAELTIGDDDDADGWLQATSVKATDMVVGEVYSMMSSGSTDTDSSSWFAVGDYIVAATGRKGRTTSGVDSGLYYGAASEVIGVVTVTDGDGTAGRSFMFVSYSVPTTVTATGAVS